MKYLLLPLLLGAGPALGQSVVSTTPASNARAVPRTTSVAATLGAAPGAGTSFRVFSAQAGGQKAGTATSSGSTVSFAPTQGFKAGETVMATLLNGSGPARVWQFTAAAGVAPGTFGGGSDVSFASNGVYALALGDADGDTDLDLFAFEESTATIHIRRNDGGGRFWTGTTVAAVVGSCMALQVADFDGDGDLDIAAAFSNNSTFTYLLKVFLNNGAGVYSSGSSLVLSVDNQGLAVGDVDGDGDLDIVAARRDLVLGPGPDGGSVCLNDGAGNFTVGSFFVMSAVPTSIKLADVDNDGDLDVLAASDATDVVDIRLNNGTGIFSGTATVTTGLYPWALATGDVDGDGDVDFLVAHAGTGPSLSVGINNGSGQFTSSMVAALPYFSAVTFSVALADVDGDGDLDAVINHGRVLLNNGAGVFAAPAVFNSSDARDIATGDVDGDGDLDIVSDNYYGQAPVAVAVRLNQTVTATKLPVSAVPSVWPNPVGRQGTVQVRFAAPTPARITLSNSLGQEVRRVASTGATTEISVAGLAPGIYVLTAQVAGQAASTRRVAVE